MLDVLDQTLRSRCLRFLCKICGRCVLLPEPLIIPVSYDRTKVSLYRGGFADVWKGTSRGLEVAVKELKLYEPSDKEKIRRVGCRWSSLFAVYVDELTAPFIGVLQGSCGMERTSPPERVATARSDYDRCSICDGVGVDVEW